MPIIASHCQPGGWRFKGEPYTPTAPWPEDTFVQWGSSGLVISRRGNYRTAFFEAFPEEPPTFIRGEGATVAEAEAAAFAKLQSYLACPGHEFERHGYTNGSGICRHCRLFASNVFAPTTHCHTCGVPTAHSMGYGRDVTDEVGKEFWYCPAHRLERLRNGHWSLVDQLADEGELNEHGIALPFRPDWLKGLAQSPSS
jgi:hypothetical protein